MLSSWRGASNLVTGDYCVIPGGVNNAAEADDATISGGANNTITGWGMSTVGGGQGNYVEELTATSQGGRATPYPAISARFQEDRTTLPPIMPSPPGTGPKQFTRAPSCGPPATPTTIPPPPQTASSSTPPADSKLTTAARNVNGSGLKWLMLASQTPGKVINVYNGAYLSEGGSWVDVCDRNAKKDFEPVNGREVLERVAKLPLTTWRN